MGWTVYTRHGLRGHGLHLRFKSGRCDERGSTRGGEMEYLNADNFDGLIPRCKGAPWEQQLRNDGKHRARHSPIAELKILSMAPNESPGCFPRADRIISSANRAKPILIRWPKSTKEVTQCHIAAHLEPQLVHCRKATALTPLLMPLMPSRR